MKKALLILALLLFSTIAFSQNDLYLIFEFMKVDNEQENAYQETEAFWEKIHQARANSGDILGWDLWALRPGGEDQQFQYLTVTLFDNAKAMFGDGNFLENVRKAYPSMSDEELTKTFNNTAKTRDLAVRIYLEQIAVTEDNFDMPLGTIAFINSMKVDLGNYTAYEKAETEVFQPMHQKDVNDGKRASWGLLRFMVPVGSDTYASHFAVDMFKDLDQALSYVSGGGDMGTLTEAQQKAIQDGLATRDLKWVSMATLIRKVRKQ